MPNTNIVQGNNSRAAGRDYIENQTNNYNFKENQSIKNIKIDFYELREIMISFTVAKVLIPLFIVFFVGTIIIYRHNSSDIAFNSLGSLSVSIISLIAFYFFNKYYYKDKRTNKEPKEDKAVVLFLIDLSFIGWMFYLNFM